MRDGIKTKVREHIVETWLNGDARGFEDSSDLHEMGVLDSFSTLGMASYLEETFNVAVDPTDINTESFRSVETIADLVESKQQRVA